jgi:NADH-quinone oxidoreductase subunit J
VLSPYLVPFLALSFILLAAAIGAMVLARKD